MKSFGSFAGLATMLLSSQETIKRSHERTLKKAGNIILKKIRDVIGTYEYGWPALADATQEERAKKGYSADEPLLRTGDFRDSFKVEADNEKVTIGSDLDYAAYSEVGTSKEPPRPVLLPSANAMKQEILKTLRTRVQGYLSGDVVDDSE